MKLADLRALFRDTKRASQHTAEPTAPELELTCDRCAGKMTIHSTKGVAIMLAYCELCDVKHRCAHCKRTVDADGTRLELETLPSGKRICSKCRMLTSIELARHVTAPIGFGSTTRIGPKRRKSS